MTIGVQGTTHENEIEPRMVSRWWESKWTKDEQR